MKDPSIVSERQKWNIYSNKFVVASMAPYNLQLQAGGLLVLHILVHLLLTNIGYMVKCVSQVRKSGIHYTSAPSGQANYEILSLVLDYKEIFPWHKGQMSHENEI